MYKLIALVLILSACNCVAQTGLKVAIEAPKGWREGDGAMLKENRKYYSFDQSELNKMAFELTTLLAVYYKYDPNEHDGIIPTIKYYSRKNSSKMFEGFFQSMKAEIESDKSQIQNFQYIDSPKVIQVGQRKTFFASSVYTLNIKTGEKPVVRTKFIGIPINDRYLYITLIDCPEEDCSALYDEIITKLKVE